MGESITGKQDRPSLIIEEKLVFKLFSLVDPCCTYVSIVMRAAFADISVPLDFM